MIRRGFLASLAGLVGFGAGRSVASAADSLRFEFGRVDPVASEPHEIEFTYDDKKWHHRADTLAGAEGFVRATVAAFEGRFGLTYKITALRVSQRERLLEYEANQLRGSDSN